MVLRLPLGKHLTRSPGLRSFMDLDLNLLRFLLLLLRRSSLLQRWNRLNSLTLVQFYLIEVFFPSFFDGVKRTKVASIYGDLHKRGSRRYFSADFAKTFSRRNFQHNTLKAHTKKQHKNYSEKVFQQKFVMFL